MNAKPYNRPFHDQSVKEIQCQIEFVHLSISSIYLLGGSRTAFLQLILSINSGRYQDFNVPSSNLGSYASPILSKFPVKATARLSFMENSSIPAL